MASFVIIPRSSKVAMVTVLLHPGVFNLNGYYNTPF